MQGASLKGGRTILIIYVGDVPIIKPTTCICERY